MGFEVGITGADGAGGDEAVDSVELSPLEGESVQDYGKRILKILQRIMDDNAEAMQIFFEVLSSGDKNKASYMMEVLEKNLEQLKKQDQAKGLKIFLKILSVFALILSALVVLINPTPFGVAMLLISIAMFLEPIVADAAGYESLIGRAFKEIFNVLKEMGLPVWAAAILMAVLVIVLVVVSAYGLAALGKLLADVGGKAFQMLGKTAAMGTGASANAAGAVTRTVESFAKTITDLLVWLKSFITDNVKNIVMAADLTALTASNVGEAAHGVIKFKVAQSQVEIDRLMAFVEMIAQGMGLTQEDAIEFKKLVYGYLEQIERMDLV